MTPLKGSDYQNTLVIDVLVGGHSIKALVDCGSTANVMTTRCAHKYGFETQKRARPYEYDTANGIGGTIDTQTKVLHMIVSRHHEDITFDVITTAGYDIILGMPWLEQNNPIVDWKARTIKLGRRNDTVKSLRPARRRSAADERRLFLIQEINELATSIKDDLETLDVDSADNNSGQLYHKAREKGTDKPFEIPKEYKKYEHLFKEETGAAALPKHQPWDHEIKLEPGTAPTFGPIYDLSEKELQALREYLDDYLEKGYIRESKSRAAHPILFVPKPNGKLRLCVDYRQLNNITVKNRYPLPGIGSLQQRLSKAKIFTKMDLRDGFHLVRIKEGDEWKTAFRTRYGLYEYQVMPFGLTNAPATFQALINNTLREYLDVFVIAYMDDILVYSEDEKQHEEHVKKILACLDQAGLRIKPEKCEWHKKNVNFLGFQIGTSGVKMDPDKVKAIQEWPVPTSLKELQGFLGFANFNRQFIEGYSRRALPLTAATRKDVLFKWTPEMQRAFDDLKERIAMDPVVKLFQADKPSRMETDASDLAIGACWLQESEGKWHPVAYHSRKMNPAEQNYDIHDKELLAIVDAMKHWRVYAESSSDLVIFSDHRNLLTFTTTKALNRRQVRWSEELAQYKFKIVHTPGKDNGRADALSRRSDYMEHREPKEFSILENDQQGNLTVKKQIFMMRSKGTLELHHDQLFSIMKHQNRICPPEETRKEIIRAHHDQKLAGHSGVRGTLEKIRRTYDWPGITEDITAYVKSCHSCQTNKSARHKPYGELKLSTVPTIPWEHITMDFITKLPGSMDPATSEVYDSILVVVDRLTKNNEFIPFKETYDAEQLSFIILDRLLRHHGLPDSITSDRDKLFTSAYWRTFTAELGIKLKLSTAFHPVTDGQTERANQTLETYLRHYVDDHQNNWVELLPMAQLAINNTIASATGQTPFFAEHGRHATLKLDKKENPASEKAILKVEDLHNLHGTVSQQIHTSNGKMVLQANKKRMNGPQLKKGDKVYLLTKNLKSRRPSKKLDHIKVGPFLIEEVKGPVNYKLQLPADAKIHPVFHISLLEPARGDAPLAKTFHFEPQEDNEYEAEAIVDSKTIDGQRKWLVKWKGYPPSENTWEPMKNLVNCQRLLREYEGKHAAPTTRSSRPRPRRPGRPARQE